MNLSFRPRILATLRHYDRNQFVQDLSAGLTVGVLALPLAMAFAIASGLNPSAGIWTGIVAGFLISALGGSRVQIGGPTGAFIPIIYGIVASYGLQNLLIATMLAGIFLFAMGAFRLGNLIRFIPISVVTGFTNGIAVVIFMSQVKDFLGLPIEHLPGEFFARVHALALGLHAIHLPTLALSLASLAVLLAWNMAARRVAWMRRAPGPLAVLVLATAANAFLALPVETIGSRFGGIPQGLPTLALPEFSLSSLGKLIAPALTIALLGAIESLLSARVADNLIDDRHDPNQELMAQGAANLLAPLAGGFAATGAIARTATNIRSGGRTPVAGIIHAAVLLGIVLGLAPLASYIPLAALSAVVVVVSVNMGDWHAFAPRELMRYSKTYRTVLLATFVVTVVFDLTLAVELGLALASLFFLVRMSELTRVEAIPVHLPPAELPRVGGEARIVAYRLYGSLFFGSANKLEALLDSDGQAPDVVVLDFDRVINIDTTGLDILQTLQRRLAQRGARLLLSGVGGQPRSLLERSGFAERVGDDSFHAHLDAALAHAALLPHLPREGETDAD